MGQMPRKTREIKPYGFESAEAAVRLDANESFISLPDALRERIAAAVAGISFNRYPDPFSRGLCEAYGRYLGIPPRNLTAGNGSDELIFVIITALLEKGGRLLLVDPDFSMYRFYASLCEVEAMILPKGPDLRITADEILKKTEEYRPSLVMLSNPCSPTGQGMERDEVLRLLAVEDVIWVIDEAYMEFWEGSVVGEAVGSGNAIVLRTCSKALGLAGIRLGFAAAGEELTAALRKTKPPANINRMTQAVGEIVLGDTGYIRGCAAEIARQSGELYRMLEGLSEAFPGRLTVYPTVANFVFIRPSGDPSAAWEYLLSKGVLVRKIGDGLRVTAGNPAENRAFIQALTEYVKEV